MLVRVAGDGARKGPHAVGIRLPGVLAHRDTNRDTVLQAVLCLSFPVGSSLFRAVGVIDGRDDNLGVEVSSHQRAASEAESGTFFRRHFVFAVSGVASIGAIGSGMGVVKPVGRLREVGTPLGRVLGLAEGPAVITLNRVQPTLWSPSRPKRQRERIV